MRERTVTLTKVTIIIFECQGNTLPVKVDREVDFCEGSQALAAESLRLSGLPARWRLFVTTLFIPSRQSLFKLLNSPKCLEKCQKLEGPEGMKSAQLAKLR